jgi:Ca2+-binding RTX toxin-like protein
MRRAISTTVSKAYGGSNFDDQLFGDADARCIDGQCLGDDLIQGRGGNDNLYGGGGNDTFVVNNGDGIDRILDFEAGAGAGDVLDISAFGFADIAAVQAASSIADGLPHHSARCQ